MNPGKLSFWFVVLTKASRLQGAEQGRIRLSSLLTLLLEKEYFILLQVSHPVLYLFLIPLLPLIFNQKATTNFLHGPMKPPQTIGVLATEDLSNHGSVIMSYLFSSFLWHFIYLLAVVYILQRNLAAAAARRSALTACRRPWPELWGRSTPNKHHQGQARSSCTWKGLQKLHWEGNPFPDTCTTS